jgi:hypothetical protein
MDISKRRFMQSAAAAAAGGEDVQPPTLNVNGRPYVSRSSRA